MRMRFFLYLRLNAVFELLFPSGVRSLRGVQICTPLEIKFKILLEFRRNPRCEFECYIRMSISTAVASGFRCNTDSISGAYPLLWC